MVSIRSWYFVTRIYMESIKLSLGTELEWSDIDRRLDIPKNLGSWEGPKIGSYYMGSEIDIVNTKGEWRGITADPLCVTCPVGGEIHVAPSYTAESQLIRIMRIMNLFSTIGIGPMSHNHVHVGIPGIHNNLEALKNLFAYVEDNEQDLLRFCYGWNCYMQDIVYDSQISDEAKDYLHFDGGKSLNPGIFRCVKDDCTCVADVLEALKGYRAYEYDWITDSEEDKELNSYRTGINLFNLTKGETVEFRCFRGTLNPEEIYSILVFCKRFVTEALKGKEGKSVVRILSEGNFNFPELNFEEDLVLGWEKTKHKKGRGGPFKKYSGFMVPREDFLLEKVQKQGVEILDDEEEKSYRIITHLCQADLLGKEQANKVL